MSVIPLYISRQSKYKSEADPADVKIIEKVKKIVDTMGLKGLVVANDGSHSGYVNSNFRKYSDKSFKQNASTFYDPFPAPVLKHHDMFSDPSDAVGRVYDAVYQPGEWTYPDGQKASGLLKVGFFIPDGEEADKITNHINITTSIGFRSSSARCSICGYDWRTNTKAKKDAEDCNHEPGMVYDQKLCYLETDIARFREVSLVTSPADMLSFLKAYARANKDSIDQGMDVRDVVDAEYSTDLPLNYIFKDIGYGGAVTVTADMKDAVNGNHQGDSEDMSEELIKQMTAAFGDIKAAIVAQTDTISKLAASIKSEPAPASSAAPSAPASDSKETFTKQDMQDMIATAIKQALEAVKPGPQSDVKPGTDSQEVKPSVDELQKKLEERDQEITRLKGLVDQTELKLKEKIQKDSTSTPSFSPFRRK